MMRSMLPALMICFVMLSSLAAVPSGAAVVDPRIADAVRSGSGEVPVIIFFRDSNDLSALRDVSTSRGDKIRMLQANAEASRRNFMAAFGGKLSDVKTFWLVNAVAATVPSDRIDAIASRDDVDRVMLDATEHLPPTVDGDDRAEGEWTYGLKKIRIPEVRQRFGLMGDGILVGIIDTGVDAEHPDLKGKVVGFKDFVNGRTEPYDDQGHGTHCCGTIAGGNAGGTYIGVAPHAKLLMAKAFSSSGSSQSSWLLEAMQFMADPDGNPDTDDAPSVVSNSWGGAPENTTYLDAVKNWIALGIFPNFAAGNSGPGAGTIGTPGGFIESFAVGATNSGDGIAYFSSRGPVTWDGVEYIKPDVSAPGYDVYSAKPGGGYTKKSGTSMACPHVSGVIALLQQASPGIGIDEIKEILEQTAKELGEPGKDNTFGSGRIDALAAVEMAASGGRLSGNLTDADSGAALAGTVRITEKELSLDTEPGTGSFRTTLPEGTYTLVGRAFGYRDSEPVKVDVVAGAEKQVHIALRKAEAGTIKGRVTAADSGAPLEATVVVLDTPLDAVHTDSDGRFSVQVPAGSYTLAITAFGYSRFTSELLSVEEHGQVEFEAGLEALPPVLLVDDDKGKTFESYYTSALELLGIGYDVYDMKKNGALKPDGILGYRYVLWFTGSDYSSTLKDEDQALLSEYLDKGGRLVLSGQDIAYDIKGGDFLKNYLKTAFEKDDSGARKVRGQGLYFPIDAGAGNQRYPDRLRPLSGGVSFLDYDGGKGSAAVLADHRAILVGFGIEGIGDRVVRKRLIDKAFKAVAPSAVEVVARISRFDDEAQRARWAEMTMSLLEDMSRHELETAADLLGRSAVSRSSRAVRNLVRSIRSLLSSGRSIR